MKIRQGFVTNSSSSSFVILSNGQLTKQMLMNAFQVPETSPFYPFAGEIADVMVQKAKPISTEKFLEEYDWIAERIGRDVILSYLNAYTGYAYNDADSAEVALCEMDFNCTTPEVMIRKEGGY